MFVLENDGSVPLYKQLYNQIREHVLSGKLHANSKLPSVRELADELSTSRNTVEGAYQELYAEGYIYSKPRSGYFVSALDQDAAPLPPVSSPRKPARYPEPSPNFVYDFHPAGLDPRSFPVALWRKCFTDCLRESPEELTRYGDPQGELRLRRSIQCYLQRSRGVVCDADQIVICAGLQQSLDIVAQVLKEHHTVVAVEDPGYHLPRSVFLNNSYEVLPVPVGPVGLDVDALKASSGTVVYVTPSHQLPLGYVMPIAARLKLIEWAESGGRLIIEDDYDSELRYSGRPIPSLQGLRPHGNIVYLGTFSKILSPALRVSYMVLPRSLLAAYRPLFRDYFSTVSFLEQRTLAHFMEQGYWDRHVRRMRILYKKKHDALIRAVERHFGDRATIVGQGAGLHVVLQLFPDAANETEIIAEAQEKGIRLLPFSATCAAGKPNSTMLMLGFGGMTIEEMEKGVELLSSICSRSA